MITGRAEVIGSARSRRVSSSPSMRGIIRSTTARSGRLALDHLQRLLAVAGVQHLEALQPQVDLDEPGDVLVVVDDEDQVGSVAGRLHRQAPATARSARPRSRRTASAGSAAP